MIHCHSIKAYVIEALGAQLCPNMFEILRYLRIKNAK